MTGLIAISTLFISSAQNPTAADIVQRSFKDASFDIKVVKAVHSELKKIKEDFGNQYRFSSIKAFVKEPLKLRTQATVDDTDITYVVNGFLRSTRVPRANFNFKEDLKQAPGKVQCALDFGIVSPSVLQLLFTASFVRTDRANNDYVFDLTYLNPKLDTSRHRVWVDPEKRYTTRREWYSQSGRHLATFYYDKPVLQAGVWMPTAVTVRNVENKVAGITEYTRVKVNGGLSDSLFTIS